MALYLSTGNPETPEPPQKSQTHPRTLAQKRQGGGAAEGRTRVQVDYHFITLLLIKMQIFHKKDYGMWGRGKGVAQAAGRPVRYVKRQNP